MEVKNGLTADFVVRGVWEPDRDCLFDTRIIHAGSPGRATQHISYQNALNTSACCEKVKKYKAAAEERCATFCPLIVTVEGIAHQSMQAFLRRIAAWLSEKWQKPLSTVSNWVLVGVQFVLMKAVDLWTRGSRKKWRSSGFKDGEGIAVLFQR